jgi:hypothetical protein
MNVFMHPALLKERENSLLSKEQDIEFRKLMIHQKEIILVNREKNIKQIAFVSFLTGITMGSLAILAFLI